MKRLTALLLVLAMVLSMSTAFAWTCPGCGAEMETKFCTECGAKKPENICPGCGFDHGENAPKFCPECGTKMGGAAAPTAAPTAEPTQAPAEDREDFIMYQQPDGRLTLLWSRSAEGPYTIKYMHKKHDSIQADLDDPASIGEITRESVLGVDTISHMVPGEAYWVGMFNAQGDGKYLPYTPEAAVQPFTAFDMTVQTAEVVRVNGEDTYPDAFDAASLLADGEGKNGLYLVMRYDNPGAALEDALVQVALTAPNGTKMVAVSTVTDFAANTKDGKGWPFLDLYERMVAIAERPGSVPVGEYLTSVYVNGQLAGEAAFQVVAGNAAAPTAAPTVAPAATAAPAAAEDDRARIASVVSNGNGTATVTWNGGKAPYKVQYTLKVSDDFNADRSAAQKVGNYWNAASGVEGNSAVLNRLIPGEEYWIAVLDANDKGQRKEFTLETAAVADMAATLELSPRQRIGENPMDIPCIPADEAGVADDTEHGVYMRLLYDNYGAAGDKNLQIVTSFANGFTYVYGSGNVAFSSGEDCWRKWEFYNLESILEHVRENYGAVPAGDLTITIYVDGKLACSAAVPVGDLKPLTITGCTPQSNGRPLLTWADNGCGPYSVYYHQRFTGSKLDDRNDDRGTGSWIDTENVAGTSLEMKYLVPGKDYWIVLRDSAGSEAVYAYTPSAVVNSNLEVSLSCTPRMRQGETVTDLAGFSAADIAAGIAAGSAEYGIYLDVDYREHKADVKRAAQFVVTLPNGQCICTDSFDMTWYAGTGCHWNYFDLSWFFGRVVKWHGEVLTGTYTLTLYPEGKYGGSVTFEVAE